MASRLRYDTSKFKKTVFEVLSKATQDTAAREEIGRYVVRSIRAAGRKGEPYNSTRSFPELEPETIERKEETRKISSPKSRSYKKGKSNLTLTGQLWEALSFTLFSSSSLVVAFDKSRRRPYIDPDTQRPVVPDPQAETNKDLADKLADGIDSKSGKKTFVAFDGEIVARDPLINRRIMAIFKDNLRRILARYFED